MSNFQIEIDTDSFSVTTNESQDLLEVVGSPGLIVEVTDNGRTIDIETEAGLILTGPVGPTGPPAQVSSLDPPVDPQQGALWVSESTGRQYVFLGSWVEVGAAFQGPAGPTGATGPIGLTGATGPAGAGGPPTTSYTLKSSNISPIGTTPLGVFNVPVSSMGLVNGAVFAHICWGIGEITHMAQNVSTAASGEYTILGIYDCLPDGRPGDLISEFGQTDSGTIGIKRVAGSALVNGFFYAAAYYNGSAQRHMSQRFSGDTPLGIYDFGLNDGAGAVQWGWRNYHGVSMTSLPTSASFWSNAGQQTGQINVTVTTTASSNRPAIGLTLLSSATFK